MSQSPAGSCRSRHCRRRRRRPDFDAAGWHRDQATGRAARHGLEVEVTDPVDDVKEQEGGGEEDPGVGIQLPDVDVDAASPPAAFFTLLVAAEEAGAVFAVQTLVQAVVLVVVPEEGVAHRHHGSGGRSHGERRVGLRVG